MTTSKDMLPSAAVPPPGKPSTLIDLLRQHAAERTAKLALTFLLDWQTEGATLTFGDLDLRARAIAALLQSVGAANERVLLIYPPSLEYVSAFLGCLYGGAVAVPVPPPRLNRNMDRLMVIAADSGARFVLTTRSILDRIESATNVGAKLDSLDWFATDDMDNRQALDWRPPIVSSATLAFLQYTSGSTTTPKGVMVTHGNLIHNQAQIRRAFGQTDQSVVLSWLPLYHDMGLIGGVLQPLYLGARCVLMSPLSFLQRPLGWLRAITRYGITTSGGPDFAYSLCARKAQLENCSSLDLSRWSVAFNGSEPIRDHTIERFTVAFEPFGFRRESFLPCYGLAEATLLASGGNTASRPLVTKVLAQPLTENRVVVAQSGAQSTKLLVGSGRVDPDQQVVIVDPATLTVLPGDCVGEIWISGPSVAAGYFNRPEESRATFQAYLSGLGKGPFLRTGDLGFIQHGELFVTGRLKDLIIIKGRNYCPNDIEATVQLSSSVARFDGGAAFSIEIDGEERLVIVQEVETRAKQDLDEVIRILRQSVADEYELAPYSVVLIRPGSIARTSSGKIRRQACRAVFLAGKLHVLAEWRMTSPSERPDSVSIGSMTPSSLESAQECLISLLSATLAIDATTIDASRPISSYGLDSLGAVDMMHALETQLGLSMPLTAFFQVPSIHELAKQLVELFNNSSTVPAVPRAHTTVTEFGLSRGQQALYLLHNRVPDVPVYNIAHLGIVRGKLNTPALRTAFQELVNRHASLRTSFVQTSSGPVQRVKQQMDVWFKEVDAGEWSQEDLNEHIIGEANHCFDLEEGCLLRITLFNIPTRPLLLLVVHHIVVDFWSLSYLLRELGALYSAELGHPPAKSAPVSQFSEFVDWQNQMLAGTRADRLSEYWNGKLGGELPSLDLPSDSPRPPKQSYAGDSQELVVPGRTAQRLAQLSRERGTTPFMLLVAAFAAFLHRYTGQDDILLGTPTSERSLARFADVVGYFVNPILLRCCFADAVTFDAFFSAMHTTILEAFEHQDYPFPLLVENLNPNRDISRPPLLQVMFVYQKAPLPNQEGLNSFAVGRSGGRIVIGEVEIESLPLNRKVAELDLTLRIASTEDGIRGSMDYNSDIFEAVTIQRMARHFERLLEGLLTEPRSRITGIQMLSEVEEHQLLAEWSNACKEHSHVECVHELFEAEVEFFPETIALVFEQKQLSYFELNRRANRLADHLRSLDVGPEVQVGVCIERSLEMVIALLAILKSGAAYLAIDPSYPEERLAFMLGDSSVAVLLTQQPLIATLPRFVSRILSLDSEGQPISTASDASPDNGMLSQRALPPARQPASLREPSNANPARRSSPENAAYVTYTSGSTGQPRGICIPHRGVVRLVRNANFAELDEEQTFLHLAPISFDASTFEIWGCLLHGGRLVVAPPGHPSLAELAGILKEQQITTLWLASGLFHLMAEEQMESLGQLRQLLAGGDVLATRWAERFLDQVRDCKLINGYGPTENTTFTACYHATAGGWSGSVPIGRPISKTEVYLLNAMMSPVPTGVRGELYAGGDGLARGYQGHAKLTAERFVPHPHSEKAGERLYRTGDVARYLTDGNVSFVGRLDDQVKVRGFRVELGEVESALRDHPALSQSVVLADADERGQKRLVAYVVPREAAQPSVAELRRHLTERLPAYMIPAAYVVVDNLPITPHGKVDRNALPRLKLGLPEPGFGYTEPRTPIEEILVDIWRQVLRVDHIGRDDNFFDLGGHSLIATQVISRVKGMLKADLPVSSLFENPTVSALAELVGRARGTRLVDAPPIVPVSRDGQIPLSLTQQRMWVLQQLEPHSTAFNISVGIRLAGHLNQAALGQALAAIIARHEVLRMTIPTKDGQPVQSISEARGSVLPVVDTGELPEESRQIERTRLTREEQEVWFNLETDPLMRAVLIRITRDEHLLLITLHHIVADGWSMRIVVKECRTFYEAFSQGRPASLTELPVQYADFAVWQRETITAEFLAELLPYWKHHLSGCAPLLELPADWPRPSVQTYRGSRKSFLLSDDLSGHLKNLSQRQGTTLFMTLMAAFNILLHRYTGQVDVVIGAPIAGRNHRGTEELIGFFVNTLVLRTDLSGDPTFTDLLARVRGVALEAYDHQDVPFERLMEELQPKRDLSYTPLFQVMLNLLNFEVERLELTGLAADVMWPVDVGSKLDLTLYVQEEGECIRFDLVYNNNLFLDDRMNEMAAQFVYLISQIVRNPHQPISSYSLMTTSAHRLLADPASPSVSNWMGPVHQAFALHARSEPDRLALVDRHESWSYRALDDSSGCLASYLLDGGIRRGEIVAVYGYRSASLVLAVMGVLKAGAAFLIIDPTYPPARVLEYLRAARPNGWIQIDSAGPIREEVREFTASIRCHIELAPSRPLRQDHLLQGPLSSQPALEIGPNDASYLAFTSGSSGEPKGVVGKHGSMAHFAHWAGTTLGIGKSDRFSMLSGISHDPLHRDMFTPLQLGGTICIPGPEELTEPGELAQWINREEITVCGLTPAMGQILAAGALAADNFSEFKSLRYAFFVGDVLSKTDVLKLQALAPSLTCINLYGATETGRAVGHFIIPGRNDHDAHQSVWAGLVKEVLPIGKGIDGVDLLVVNSFEQQAGIGEIGEIWFRSPYLARGYLENGADPRHRFTTNPFTGTEEDSIYKTGDLGRYTPDGCIEFLGRADRQIKIRGFRIELQEVEAVLVTHPGVQGAHVMVRADNPDDRRLVAYVVAAEAASATARALRAFLKDRLPAFMVPSLFVLLEELPLTLNGKVDTKALPVPTAVDIEGESEGPPSEIEKTVVAIWAEVLGLERVGINQNFFDLGGHSLLATQVVSRMRTCLGVEVPLRSLFSNPTVAALAASLTESNAVLRNEPAAIQGGTDWESLLSEVEHLSEDEAKAWLSSEIQGRNSMPRS